MIIIYCYVTLTTQQPCSLLLSQSPLLNHLRATNTTLRRLEKWTVLPVCRRRSPTARGSAQPVADEVLQVIFNEIDNPSSFIVVCRRFNSFSRDPYVRAHYFLSRYGSVQALYWALGRGQLITEQVLDVSALYFLPATSYMRALSSSSGLVKQWGAPLPLPRSDRHPPQLSFSLPFHQDPLGSDFKPVDIWAFFEAIVGEIWEHQHSKRGG